MASSASGLAPSWLLGGSSGSGSGLGTSLVLRVLCYESVCYESCATSQCAQPFCLRPPALLQLQSNRIGRLLHSLVFRLSPEPLNPNPLARSSTTDNVWLFYADFDHSLKKRTYTRYDVTRLFRYLKGARSKGRSTFSGNSNGNGGGFGGNSVGGAAGSRSAVSGSSGISGGFGASARIGSSGDGNSSGAPVPSLGGPRLGLGVGRAGVGGGAGVLATQPTLAPAPPPDPVINPLDLDFPTLGAPKKLSSAGLPSAPLGSTAAAAGGVGGSGAVAGGPSGPGSVWKPGSASAPAGSPAGQTSNKAASGKPKLRMVNQAVSKFTSTRPIVNRQPTNRPLPTSAATKSAASPAPSLQQKSPQQQQQQHQTQLPGRVGLGLPRSINNTGNGNGTSFGAGTGAGNGNDGGGNGGGGGRWTSKSDFDAMKDFSRRPDRPDYSRSNASSAGGVGRGSATRGGYAGSGIGGGGGFARNIPAPSSSSHRGGGTVGGGSGRNDSFVRPGMGPPPGSTGRRPYQAEPNNNLRSNSGVVAQSNTSSRTTTVQKVEFIENVIKPATTSNAALVAATDGVFQESNGDGNSNNLYNQSGYSNDANQQQQQPFPRPLASHPAAGGPNVAAAQPQPSPASSPRTAPPGLGGFNRSSNFSGSLTAASPASPTRRPSSPTTPVIGAGDPWAPTTRTPSWEAEERLLREMGWSNLNMDDDLDEEEGGLTEAEIAQFKMQSTHTVGAGVGDMASMGSAATPGWMSEPHSQLVQSAFAAGVGTVGVGIGVDVGSVVGAVVGAVVDDVSDSSDENM